VDDALSVGLISTADLAEVPFWNQAVERVRALHPEMKPEQFQPTVVRRLIDWQVADLLDNTQANLQAERVTCIEDVRRCERLLVTPSAVVKKLKADLEAFLFERVYRHYRVMRMASKGQRMLRRMFEEFQRQPRQLPPRYQELAVQESVPQAVCDYLAGMTDRYAQDEYLRLFQPYATI
jgi:dGTPase